MKPLYEISNKYKYFVDQAIECDELTAEQLAMIDQLHDNLEDKAVQVASFIKNLEAESNAIDKAIQEMDKRSLIIAKKIYTLKNYLKDNLEKCDIKEVKSTYFDIKIKYNPPAINIIDESKIPDQYVSEVISRRIDKYLISNDLKNNIDIPGVSIVRNTRLEIR